MHFTKHFYTIFGTNLLTEGLVQIAVFFSYFSVSQKRNIKRNPNGMKPSGELFFGTNVIQGTWSGRQERSEEATRQGGAPAPLGAAPPSWAPRSSPDWLLSPIYTHIPRKHPRAPRNPISIAATFCTREIPSWGLFRRSARGGMDHGGQLHQLYCPSDEAWVVYHGPMGP